MKIRCKSNLFFKISTEVIRKKQNKLLNFNKNTAIKQYPRTFEHKIQLLNDPRSIQAMQIIQFGVKYPRPRWVIPLILLLAALFGYIHSHLLPQRIIDRYLSISIESGSSYWIGYISAALNYEKPFYLYIPLLAVVYQMSRFIQLPLISFMVILNSLSCTPLASYLVHSRVSQYEVWDQQRVCYGEATAIFLAITFWNYLGIKQGLIGIKSKIMMKSIPGLGIIRQGIPIGLICTFYLLFEIYCTYTSNHKNQQLVWLSVINGVIMGLIARKFKLK